jgi:cell division septal protein FtsQ
MRPKNVLRLLNAYKGYFYCVLGLCTLGVSSYFFFLYQAYWKEWLRSLPPRLLNLKIDQIVLEGRKWTSEKDIWTSLSSLGLRKNGSILEISPWRIREQLLCLPWIKDAVVVRNLPNTFYIHLKERVPIGVWIEGVEPDLPTNPNESLEQNLVPPLQQGTQGSSLIGSELVSHLHTQEQQRNQQPHDGQSYFIDEDGQLVLGISTVYPYGAKNPHFSKENDCLRLSANDSCENKDRPKEPQNWIHVYGEKAYEPFPALLETLKKFSGILKAIRKVHWRDARRWDLYWNNDILIKLPATKCFEALERLEIFLGNYDINLFRSIDLRFGDELLVKKKKNHHPTCQKFPATPNNPK